MYSHFLYILILAYGGLLVLMGRMKEAEDYFKMITEVSACNNNKAVLSKKLAIK